MSYKPKTPSKLNQSFLASAVGSAEHGLSGFDSKKPAPSTTAGPSSGKALAPPPPAPGHNPPRNSGIPIGVGPINWAKPPNLPSAAPAAAPGPSGGNAGASGSPLAPPAPKKPAPAASYRSLRHGSAASAAVPGPSGNNAGASAPSIASTPAAGQPGSGPRNSARGMSDFDGDQFAKDFNAAWDGHNARPPPPPAAPRVTPYQAPSTPPVAPPAPRAHSAPIWQPPPPPQAGFLPAAPMRMAPAAPTAPTVPRYNNGLPIDLWTLADEKPRAWERIVGALFMWSGLSPMDVLWPRNEAPLGLGNGLWAKSWERDWAKLDQLEKDVNSMPHWPKMSEQEIQLMQEIPEPAIRYAIRRWAVKDLQLRQPRLKPVLEGACWTQDIWGSAHWMKMVDLKQLPEGVKRERELAAAKAASPKLFDRFYNDPTCGSRKKRSPEDPDVPADSVYSVTNELHQNQEHYNQLYEEKFWAARKKNKNKMTSFGKPTQIHAVPFEERAYDSRGKRLPWAHEWPEGHPNARGHRRQPEEKGSFGKSSVRKGSSRATRTATPAKREVPGLDGFHEVWTKKEAAERKPQPSPTINQADGTSTHCGPSHSKEPTEVILYGYSTSTQWAAIDYYEAVSGGMICEDYERQPPMNLRRFPNPYSSPKSVHSRALTPAEKSLAFKYRGGQHWIKVTFDSAEAAERAIDASPHRIQGHSVFAQEYRGVGPDFDEPILYNAEVNATRRLSQTLGPSFGQKSNIGSRNATTLPRSFTTGAMPQAFEHGQTDVASCSPSTASSATATSPSNGKLRNRYPSQAEENRSSITSPPNGEATAHPQGFTHFPDIPRTILRPASEAFLPQPTRWERLYQSFVNAGLFPGDFIGNGAPRLENGDFDYASASFYWQFCHWVDTRFGTDLCGLKD